MNNYRKNINLSVLLIVAFLSLFVGIILFFLNKTNKFEYRSSASGDNRSIFSYNTLLDEKRNGFRHIQVESGQTYLIVNTSRYTGQLKALGCNSSNNQLNSCQNWKLQSPWKFNDVPLVMVNGVLKLSFNSEPRSYHVKYAPINSNNFSEELVLEIVSQYSRKKAFYPVSGQNYGLLSVSSPVNVKDYFNLKPGNSYQYTVSAWTQGRAYVSCSTEILYEEPRKVCNEDVIPVRYWKKNSTECYWGPKRNENMRYFIADPSKNNFYNDAIWAVGFAVYDRASELPLTLNVGNFKRRYFFNTAGNANYPAYFLAPKILDSETFDFRGDASCYTSTTNSAPYIPEICDKNGQHLHNANCQNRSAWRAHVRKTTVSTPAYSGEALQLIAWEENFDKSAVLREDTYYAKNIGIVRITQKRFGQIERNLGFSTALNWDQDEDYYNAEIKYPIMDMKLQKYKIL